MAAAMQVQIETRSSAQSLAPPPCHKCRAKRAESSYGSMIRRRDDFFEDIFKVNHQQKKPMILPPMCLSLHSSWVKMPWVVERTRCPNCLEGRMLLVHFSNSGRMMSYLGEMTPHLLILPISSITIFLLLWSSTIQNYPIQLCFCIILRNLMRTLETGLRSTCFLPFLQALTIVLRASARILTFTIVADNKQYLIFQSISHQRPIYPSFPQQFLQNDGVSRYFIKCEKIISNLTLSPPRCRTPGRSTIYLSYCAELSPPVSVILSTGSKICILSAAAKFSSRFMTLRN